jgi:hypothetical protein
MNEPHAVITLEIDGVPVTVKMERERSQTLADPR